MGDLLLVFYFDFEKTTGSDLFLEKKDVRDQLLFNICISFKLKMDRIVVYGSFQHWQDELFDLSHLKGKKLQYVDPTSLDQLKG